MAVTRLLYRHLKLKAVIQAIRRIPPQIIAYPRCTKICARQTISLGLLGSYHAHTLGTVQENLVLIHQFMIHLQKRRKLIQQLLQCRITLFIPVSLHTAKADIPLRHACAAQGRHDLQRIFTLLIRIKHGRNRTQVHNINANAHHIRGQSHDLAAKHTQQAGTLRDFHPQQLLHRQRIRQIIIHPGQIIQTVGVRHTLHISTAFQQLLHAAVQITDLRVGRNTGLAVKIRHDPQNTVGTGVLRAHIQRITLAVHIQVLHQSSRLLPWYLVG